MRLKHNYRVALNDRLWTRILEARQDLVALNRGFSLSVHGRLSKDLMLVFCLDSSSTRAVISMNASYAAAARWRAAFFSEGR